MKYRPGWTVFSSFTVHPGRGAQRAPPPPRPASMDVPASRTRGVLSPVAVVLVSSTAPRRARVPPSGAAGRPGTYLLAAECQAHAQGRGAASSSPWASTQLTSEVTASASTTPPSQRWPMFRHVPARCRHACSTRACLARSRCACLSAI